VGALFERPGKARYRDALVKTERAIDASHTVLQGLWNPPATSAAGHGDRGDGAPREARHQLQRIRSHLHFIRTALIDPQSPLAAYALSDGANPGVSQGVNHAS